VPPESAQQRADPTISPGDGGGDGIAPRAFLVAGVHPAHPKPDRQSGLRTGIVHQTRRLGGALHKGHLRVVRGRGRAHLAPDFATGHTRRLPFGTGRGGIAEINGVLQMLAGVHRGNRLGGGHAHRRARLGVDIDLHGFALGIRHLGAGLQLLDERAGDGFESVAGLNLDAGGCGGGGMGRGVCGIRRVPGGGGVGQRLHVVGRQSHRGGIGGDVIAERSGPIMKLRVGWRYAVVWHNL